jgi:hypothetical protein
MATSSTAPLGLPTLSVVFGRSAARHATGSSGSVTKSTEMPRSANVYANRLYVPPYSLAAETMWSPARAMFSSARADAACPLATATAAKPFSRSASRSSTTDVVGLDNRV